MNTALFYDTETSGLPLFSEPSEDPRQPHIVQLGALLPTEAMRRAGRNNFKTPKLTEAYRHLFGRELQNAHSAMADAQACREIYQYVKRPVPVARAA